MISHCVPDGAGSADRARAWQLLKEANRVYDVALICLHDGPTNLTQWQAVDQLADRVMLEQASLWQYMADRRGRLIEPTVKAWQDVKTFQSILVTHPALHACADHCQVEHRICDFGLSANELSGAKDERRQQLERVAGASCDIVLLGQSNQQRLVSNQSYQTVITPQLVDLESYPAYPAYDTATLSCTEKRVGIYAKHRSTVRQLQRRVLKMVPDAQVQQTQTITPDTTVLIVTENAPWPVLTAMASQCPVIAPHRPADQLLASPNVDLIAAGSIQQQAAGCIELLRTPLLHRNMAGAGRQFVETRRQLTTQIAPWTLLSLSRPATAAGLAIAA